MSDKTLRNIIITTLIIGVTIIIGTTIIFIIKGNLNFRYLIDSNLTSAYGEFIGGLVGTIFTILATFLIWLTYNSQKIELEKTINIASEQSATSKLQNITSRQQQFESTFFNMTITLLNLPNKLSGELPTIRTDFGKPSLDNITTTKYEGQDFIAQSLKCFKLTTDPSIDWTTKTDQELFNYTSGKYDSFYDSYLGVLDHYFRYVYNILKFVDNSSMVNKKLYIDLLQAQLSKDELGLLFYNGLGKYGYRKLYDLMEKYNFLENLNKSSLFAAITKQAKLYKYTTFKFLPGIYKLGIVVQSLIDNPDQIPENNLYYYYVKKYNLTENEIGTMHLNFMDKLKEANIDFKNQKN